MEGGVQNQHTESGVESIKRLACPKCGDAMALTLLEPAGPKQPDHDTRHFWCQVCDHSEKLTVKFR